MLSLAICHPQKVLCLYAHAQIYTCFFVVVFTAETMLNWWWITTLFLATTAATAFTQGQSEYKNCATDYAVLEKAVFNVGSNLYKLTTTFFPPHVSNPLYVTVTYHFSNMSIKYIWSSASLYLTIHPRIIRYLSLLFCYVEDSRIEELDLQLPDDCRDLTRNHMSDKSNFLFVLTQRVKKL